MEHQCFGWRWLYITVAAYGCWLRMLLDAAAVKGHWSSTGQPKSHAPHPQPEEREVLVPVGSAWRVGDEGGGISAEVEGVWGVPAAAAAAAARSACCRATLAALFAFICSNAGSCCKHHNATRNVGCS